MTYDKLIEIAKKEGYNLDYNKIWKMEKSGLIPVPKRTYLGRKGSEAIFPEWVSSQLLEVCRLKKINKNSNFIAWNLFLNKFYVDLPKIKNVLLKGVELFEHYLEKISSTFKGHDIMQTSEKIIESMDPIRQLSYKEKVLMSANSGDTELISLAIRLLLKDKSILQDLKFDIEDSEFLPGNEMLYIDKIQNSSKLVIPTIINQSYINELPSLIAEMKSMEIIKHFNDMLTVLGKDLKKVVEDIKTHDDLKDAQHLIRAFMRSSKLLNTKADWTDPMAAFFVVLLIGDDKLLKNENRMPLP